MLTAVDACSQALNILGARSIASLEEPSLESRTAAQVYERTRKWLLSVDEWTFARTLVDLSPLVSQPVSNWAYVYREPADLLRLVDVSSGGSPIAFEVIGPYIHTDAASLRVQYIADVAEQSTPAWWDAVLVLMLAVDMAVPITESVTKRQQLQSDAGRALIGAKAIDRNQAAKQPRSVPLFLAAREQDIA